MNKEFVEKMVQAKQLEKEAFLSLVDPQVMGHLQTIEKEFMSMIVECIMKNVNLTSDMFVKYSQKDTDNQEGSNTEGRSKNTASRYTSKKKTVRKVDIE